MQLAFGWLATDAEPLVLVSLFDVSAARAAEQESAKRQRSILEHAAQGIFSIRVTEPQSFVFEAWNAETERSTGLPRARVRRFRPRDFLPEDEAIRVEARY